MSRVLCDASVAEWAAVSEASLQYKAPGLDFARGRGSLAPHDLPRASVPSQTCPGFRFAWLVTPLALDRMRS